MLVLIALLAVCAAAQRQTGGGSTVLVLPFENRSGAPGIDWIGEAFPEVLGSRLSSPNLYFIGREDRLYALERLGLPSTARLSRATLYRIAEQMDADYVVLGSYNFDGRTFSATAQLLNMARLRLLPEFRAQGPLTSLIEVQTSLAWELLRVLRPQLTISRNDFLTASPAVRLDAFENYMRGTVATSRPEKLRYFREAVRLNPSYNEALLQLGKAQYLNRDYEQAVTTLSKIREDAPQAGQAGFYLGLAAFYRGQYARAETAFGKLAQQLPLTEVINNMGVAAARQGKRSAVGNFQAAVQADPRDADYRFNYALALLRAGDNTGAVRQLKEAVSLRPGDAEARALLDSLTAPGTQPGGAVDSAGSAAGNASSAGPRVPLERLKRNYDETAFRLLALEIQNAKEQSLAEAEPEEHAAAHVERGLELLRQSLRGEAEREFREAILLDPTNAAAHAGLAAAIEERDPIGARKEAETSLRLMPTVTAHLVMARLHARENRTAEAAEAVRLALALEPGNPEALELQRTLASGGAQRP